MLSPSAIEQAIGKRSIYFVITPSSNLRSHEKKGRKLRPFISQSKLLSAVRHRPAPARPSASSNHPTRGTPQLDRCP